MTIPQQPADSNQPVPQGTPDSNLSRAQGPAPAFRMRDFQIGALLRSTTGTERKILHVVTGSPGIPPILHFLTKNSAGQVGLEVKVLTQELLARTAAVVPAGYEFTGYDRGLLQWGDLGPGYRVELLPGKFHCLSIQNPGKMVAVQTTKSAQALLLAISSIPGARSDLIKVSALIFHGDAVPSIRDLIVKEERDDGIGVINAPRKLTAVQQSTLESDLKLIQRVAKKTDLGW